MIGLHHIKRFFSIFKTVQPNTVAKRKGVCNFTPKMNELSLFIENTSEVDLKSTISITDQYGNICDSFIIKPPVVNIQPGEVFKINILRGKQNIDQGKYNVLFVLDNKEVLKQCIFNYIR